MDDYLARLDRAEKAAAKFGSNTRTSLHTQGNRTQSTVRLPRKSVTMNVLGMRMTGHTAETPPHSRMRSVSPRQDMIRADISPTADTAEATVTF